MPVNFEVAEIGNVLFLFRNRVRNRVVEIGESMQLLVKIRV
jgi:hypothetical protein